MGDISFAVGSTYFHICPICFIANSLLAHLPGRLNVDDLEEFDEVEFEDDEEDDLNPPHGGNWSHLLIRGIRFIAKMPGQNLSEDLYGQE